MQGLRMIIFIHNKVNLEQLKTNISEIMTEI